MPKQPGPARRLATAAAWPAGVALTSWSYLWRITPLHRSELDGALDQDGPPPLPAGGVDLSEIQEPAHGVGPLLHRIYSGRVREPCMGAAELVAHIAADPNRVAPSSLARFQKVRGDDGVLRPGDEFVVRMPGPWDGPVRAVDVTPTSFRFATLAGHLEAGQIEWGARERDGLEFRVESWARSGDRVSALLHDRLRMAKEVQLHMWSSVVERVARLAGDGLVRGIDIETRRAEWPGG